MVVDPEAPNAAPPTLPVNPGVPQTGALVDAVKVLSDVMRNEETRFSNLNTRAVAIVSATSLITAIAGFFSRDLLGTTFSGWGRTVGQWGLLLTLVGLVATAVQIIVWVLLPKGRLVFGKNALTDSPATLVSQQDVNEVAFVEYLAIYRSLVTRNTEKANALNKGYLLFLTTVGIIGATVSLVVISTL
ncbi:MAG: hypothetical protein M3326_08490 [Actinomycetota bacterium]|nr:hypothetical protein [Actinomycetota bacterium]